MINQGTINPFPHRPARMRAYAPIFLILAALALPGPAAAAVQALGTIEAAVSEHVAASLEGERDVEFSVGRLDPRLRLPVCDRALLTRFAHAARQGTGTARSVEVRCEGERPWSLYVPVSIARYAEVVVAARALPRGVRIAAADLLTERRRVSAARASHLGEAGAAVGLVTTRAVPAGQPLSANLLRRPRLVQRGDRVVLASANPAIRVRMSGRALEDGAAGERISVRNLSSERVVEGMVSESGVVVIRTGPARTAAR